jgi:ribosome-associated heat shock protein Hsp15
MAAPNLVPAETERVRLDKWLWAARFFKTRSAAAHAVEGGKVKLDDERVKPARPVRLGDRLSIRIGAFEWIVTVRALSDRRGPASVAHELYEEDEPSRERRSAAVARMRAGFDPEPAHGGRPEKRERRELRRMRGY